VEPASNTRPYWEAEGTREVRGSRAASPAAERGDQQESQQSSGGLGNLQQPNEERHQSRESSVALQPPAVSGTRLHLSSGWQRSAMKRLCVL